MRITNRNPLGPLHPLQRHRVGQHLGGANGEKQPDKLSLSDAVKQMRIAEAERVAKLKAAIEGGQYQVDLEKLARAIVEKDLL